VTFIQPLGHEHRVKAQVIENVDLLAATDTFESSIRDMTIVARDFSSAYVYFHCAVDSDQPGNLQLQQSSDLEVWEEVGPTAPYIGDTGVMEISSVITQRYAQAVYTNTGIQQDLFTMTTGVGQS
jgi:hypothetical protein